MAKLKELIAAAVLLGGLSACNSTAAPGEDPAPRVVNPEAVGTDTSAEGDPAAADTLAGRVVALDPGHNGKNAANPQIINERVPDGRGGTKACNTTGTATADGYPEHKFNFGVAQAMRSQLEDFGATVVMSRDTDDGVGPCVDERGTFAGEAEADILVSIHANGSTDDSISGFGVITAPGDFEDESAALAGALVKGLKGADFTVNRHGYGADGLVERRDLAGLNHAEVPAALVECGEMRNRGDAEVMETEEGQRRYAEALVAGIVEFFEQ